jgi:hypothetical protein
MILPVPEVTDVSRAKLCCQSLIRTLAERLCNVTVARREASVTCTLAFAGMTGKRLQRVARLP